MKKFLKFLLILILAIIIVAVALGVFLWVKNPLGLRDMVIYQITKDADDGNGTAAEALNMDMTYDHPLLNTTQEAQLREAGIDPANLPTEITEDQQNCAKDKLGEERIMEILGGQEPTTFEILQLSTCL